MSQEMELKEKEIAYVAQVKRDHQVWSSGDDDEDFNNIEGKQKICMVAIVDEDGSTKLEKNYYFMAKDRTLSVVE